jgi:hypothetical protein
MSGEPFCPRAGLDVSAAIVAEPFDCVDATAGECFANVAKAREALGGSIAYGWALAEYGPSVVKRRSIKPLYCRWVNHILWRDQASRLWEVTPRRDRDDPTIVAWCRTYFVPDSEATFEGVEEGICWARPSWYVATRTEGLKTAECLCRAERVRRKLQEHWLDRALESLRLGGFVPKKWIIENTGERIKNIWLIAE